MRIFQSFLVIPRETTLTNFPLYIAYQRFGTGHYDAKIEAQHEPSVAPLVASTVLHADSNQRLLQPEGVVKQITSLGCRCGRGSAKKKE